VSPAPGTVRGMPPGRTGVLWLQHRLELARTAADRLDQKLRVLRSRRAALAEELRRTGPAWDTACREAQQWLDRLLLLAGERALCPEPGSGPAEVTTTWTTAMGVTYPVGASCGFPDPDPREAPLASAALPPAREACRRALGAAAEHAAVSRAAAELDGEIGRTRLRLRGIERHWLPRLEAALASAQRVIDEEEHADGIRLRWARDVVEDSR
jgi:V/A-type H+/Na+-transporting ATPase subunit D